jgi:hypothetical protein
MAGTGPAMTIEEIHHAMVRPFSAAASLASCS